MVRGLEKFREAFKDFTDNYVIIGGTACDVILSGTDMRPRSTDDIDMILVVENMTAEFARAFWQFIKEGAYKSGQRKRGEDESPAYELYRFEDAKDGYPVKIELLSRHSNLLGEPSGFLIEPIPAGEDGSSLSAIMMDEDFYALTVNNSFVENDVRFASTLALICLKAKAYLNLLDERKAGKSVNTKDIKKHRNDVLKLVATSPVGETIAVTPNILSAIDDYIKSMRELLAVNAKSLEDALQRTEEDIRAYLEVLGGMFTTA